MPNLLRQGWAARRSPGWALALSPFLWVAMELARTYLITGFPWNLLGYAVQATGVRQIATVTGVYGLSFLAVATSALLAWVLVSSLLRGKAKIETRNSKLEIRYLACEFRISIFEQRLLLTPSS